MVNKKSFAIKLARKAGKIIKKNFNTGIEKKWKNDNTPVTAVDIEINSLVIKEINKAFPEDSILAEEESRMIEGKKSVWVCDPIDGTIPFSHGVPTCVFSLALVDDGKVIMAVIYDPFIDRMFFAEKGKGAFLNGKKIEVSKSTSFKPGVIGIGGIMPNAIQELKELGARPINVGSILYMGMLVATGEFLGVFFRGRYAHDAATMKLIVEEAGGKVTDVQGNDQRYDGFINGAIASNGKIHDKLVEIVGREHISRG